jgi:hypothetical protein
MNEPNDAQRKAAGIVALQVAEAVLKAVAKRAKQEAARAALRANRLAPPAPPR